MTYLHTNSKNTFNLPHGQSWWHFHMHEPTNLRIIESTLNSILIIKPIKTVRHWCLTEFIGNSLEVEVWPADMCAAKSSATTEWQLKCKSDVRENSTSLFINLCENMNMVMKIPKFDIRLIAAYFELFFFKLKKFKNRFPIEYILRSLPH
jgi:hypothetical protein